MNFVNPSAVSKPKRRNKKRDFQTFRVLGLMGLAMFVLTGCATSSSKNAAPKSTLEKAVVAAVATNQTGQFPLKNEATFGVQLCFGDAQPEMGKTRTMITRL